MSYFFWQHVTYVSQCWGKTTSLSSLTTLVSRWRLNGPQWKKSQRVDQLKATFCPYNRMCSNHKEYKLDWQQCHSPHPYSTSCNGPFECPSSWMLDMSSWLFVNLELSRTFWQFSWHLVSWTFWGNAEPYFNINVVRTLSCPEPNPSHGMWVLLLAEDCDHSRAWIPLTCTLKYSWS